MPGYDIRVTTWHREVHRPPLPRFQGEAVRSIKQVQAKIAVLSVRAELRVVVEPPRPGTANAEHRASLEGDVDDDGDCGNLRPVRDLDLGLIQPDRRPRGDGNHRIEHVWRPWI